MNVGGVAASSGGPVEAAARPVQRYYRSPAATHMKDGAGYVNYVTMINAARANRLLALQRISGARWSGLPTFHDVTENGAFCAGRSVAAMHGDASYGRQGAESQACEVLALCNDLLRLGGVLHPYRRRVYAWAALFSVVRIETFVVAANNFGRLRRLWPSAVFLPRSLADGLNVAVAEEPGMKDYLVKLADKAERGDGPPLLGSGRSISELPNRFRCPSTAVRPLRVADATSLKRRGLLAPTCGGCLVRARAYFALKRWLPSRPSWWVEYGPSVETPQSLSC